jgi:urease beta subunit
MRLLKISVAGDGARSAVGGLRPLNTNVRRTIIYIYIYIVRMATTADRTIQLAAHYQRERKNSSMFHKACECAEELGMKLQLDAGKVALSYEDEGETVEVDVVNADAVSRAVHEMQQRALERDLQRQTWRGAYARELAEQAEVVHPFTHRVLAWKEIPCELECALVALRERFWATRNYCTHVRRR